MITREQWNQLNADEQWGVVFALQSTLSKPIMQELAREESRRQMYSVFRQAFPNFSQRGEPLVEAIGKPLPEQK